MSERLISISSLLICLLVLRPTILNAADLKSQSATQIWSLDQITRRAVEMTPELKALSKDIIRADQLAKQAGRWDNPESSISYGPMSQAGMNGTSLDLSLSQSIPLFGQRSIARAVGDQVKQSTEIEATYKAITFKHDVARTTYKLAAAIEQFKHIAHRREKISLVAKFLGTRPFASPAQSVEKNLILNRLREVEEKFLEISSAKDTLWNELNIYLALDQSIEPSVKWIGNEAIPSKEKFLKLFQNQNPELNLQKSLLATSNLQIEQAGKKIFPDIRLGAAYQRQTADFPQQVYVGTLQFSIPVLDRGSNAKYAAIAEKESIEFRLEQKQRAFVSQFEQDWIGLIQNRKRIDLFPLTLISDLEAQMEKAESNWKKGLVPVTAFLELENQVHEQAVKVFGAQTSYIEHLSQIQRLAGTEFSLEDK